MDPDSEGEDIPLSGPLRDEYNAKKKALGLQISVRATTSKRPRYETKLAPAKVPAEAKTVLVVDCREPSEPQTYAFKLDGAPLHLTKTLKKLAKNGQSKFEFVDFESGAECAGGLVDENHPNAQDMLEEVQEYLDLKCTKTNSFAPPCNHKISYYISLASS
jgi:hypothetical protein